MAIQTQVSLSGSPPQRGDKSIASGFDDPIADLGDRIAALDRSDAEDLWRYLRMFSIPRRLTRVGHGG
jgi:hypothetical protein